VSKKTAVAVGRRMPWGRYLRNNFALYTMIIPGVVTLILFNYLPMFGIVMAFQKFKPAKGFFRSPWADPLFKYFIQMVKDPFFMRCVRNTLILGVETLIFSFPAPIVFALLINELKDGPFKRVSQTISYMPYFLSTVIVVGCMKSILSISDGPINVLIEMCGGEKINFFNSREWFRPMYIISGIWQTVGYNSIIYLAAISGIDTQMYEAAVIDGATRIQQIIHITLPSIMPTMVILLIFAVSGIVGNDFQKILLMYNATVYETADVINTYVFRAGIEGAQFSYTAAVGLTMSVVSFLLLVLTNAVARKVNETSLW